MISLAYLIGTPRRLFPVFWAGAVGVMLGISGCETTPTTSANGTSAASTGSDLNAGKRLYYGRCTSCHAPEPIGDYTRSEWREMVGHMRKRAKLTPSEEASLIAFLTANAPEA